VPRALGITAKCAPSTRQFLPYARHIRAGQEKRFRCKALKNSLI
jgi:hypothetical protein